MSRIFIINNERRNWSKRNREAESDRRVSHDITRRYLMIVDQPEIRDLIKKEFTVYPHTSGEESMFYCITKPYFRRAKEFVETIFFKLKKNQFPESQLNEVKVFTA